MTICDHPASSGSFPTGTFPARLITGLLSIPSFNLVKPTQSRLCPSMMVQISSCANSAMPWADHCPVARSCFFDRDVRLAILSCPEPSIPSRQSCARMYGPAVRSKMELREGERESCINVFGL
jgi:hypothetical protein